MRDCSVTGSISREVWTILEFYMTIHFHNFSFTRINQGRSLSKRPARGHLPAFCVGNTYLPGGCSTSPFNFYFSFGILYLL